MYSPQVQLTQDNMGLIRFYPTVRILTAMLREIPTNDNLILFSPIVKLFLQQVAADQACIHRKSN